MLYNESRNPDFAQLEKVLRKEVPDRPVIAELFLNEHIYETVPPEPYLDRSPIGHAKRMARAYELLGYDYTAIHLNDFRFKANPTRYVENAKSKSLNDGITISDRESFDRYSWEHPADFGTEVLEALGADMPKGMKLILLGPSGVLENVIGLTGYDNLCMMLYEDPELVSDLFECVGSRLIEYYQTAMRFDFIGAVFSNDDWGFNKQTMLSPADMRKYCFPWHKQIVEMAHANGKYALLHSCGNYDEVIEDVICDMQFDARHSYEDNIIPVEEAYEDLQGRIAVIGGIDVDFMTRADEQAIYDRSRAMLERSASRGGYALGTGNSIAPYIPDSHYFAMIRAAAEFAY